MHWFLENYQWEIVVLLAVATAVIAWRQLRQREVSTAVTNSGPVTISSVAGGSGNIQTPVQIGQARDIHIGDAVERPAPAKAVRSVRPLPNIQYVGARPVSLDGPLDGLYERMNTPEKNAVVILFANESRPDSRTAEVYVKAVLIYYDGENELCDITGSWIGGVGDIQLFDADGKRHRLIAGIKNRKGFVVIGTQRYQEMMGTVYVREAHLIQNPKPTLFVRLTNANGVVLYEGRFALTAAPLGITRVLEPIV